MLSKSGASAVRAGLPRGSGRAALRDAVNRPAAPVRKSARRAWRKPLHRRLLRAAAVPTIRPAGGRALRFASAQVADGAPAGAAIGHGATYSAHLVSAAIALEVLRLYDEGGILANGQAVAPHFAAVLDRLLDHPLVGDARHRGLLGALELVSDKASKRGFDPALGLSDRLFETGYRTGLIFRSFGDHILGFAPAPSFSEDEFAQMAVRLKKTLDDVLAARDVRTALA